MEYEIILKNRACNLYCVFHFRDEYPNARLLLVSLDTIRRLIDGIEVYPIMDFLQDLWVANIYR